jgi:diguanylate cyclase (GGDEF)-like protein
MRRKIALALLAIAACSVASAAVAVLYVQETVETLRGIGELHRGEDLRRHLAVALQRLAVARAVLAAAAVATVGAALVLGRRLARAIARPAEELASAMRAVAAGDLGRSLPADGQGELAELGGHFNAMSAALREAQRSLRAEIDERRSAEARLLFDAFHDALTGLPNRALFLDRLEHVIDSVQRHPNERYAVLFLDLDRFKLVNDSLGHLVGDHLLAAVGERIGSALRPGDTVARLGGDEFGVLLQGLREPADAVQVAERIQQSLARAVHVDGHELFVAASIGIALQSERYGKPDEVLRDADIAMYQAKLKGRACSELFDAAMHGTVVDRMKLEAELRRAVEHGDDFVLQYQPIVALRTGRIIGLEALVRWRHSARGLLDASDFLPLAEESGTIVPLGEWAIRAACEQLRSWQDRVPALAAVTLSVNLSGRQFRRPDCVEALRRLVREAGIDPRLLAVEVTERALMDDVEASAAKLARLRDMGVQIHVDDFGTGYSSLSYLHRFPISAVKIDRSFVAGLATQAESEEVVKAIVSIAESLDFDVIAEGVEHEAQLAKLEALRCRYGQGHLVSRPLDAAGVEAWASTQVRGVA